MEALRNWLIELGLSPEQALLTGRIVAALAVIALAVLVNWIAKRLILRVVSSVIRRTRTGWDDALLERNVFTRFSHLAPALVLWGVTPLVLGDVEGLVVAAGRLAEIYMIVIGLLVASAFLNAVTDIYRKYEIAQRVPIRGYVQVVKIVLGIGGGIFALSIVLDKSPWVFLSGMGALTAILLLVFRDTILGLVAGIQLNANDMVRPGDWIEMGKYGADGDVLEVTLTTVKVRNWDKTITTIPTYALISDSFKNWRGMEESGGRRIKRALHIDVNSIRYCTPEMVERFSRIERIRDYVKAKQQEIEQDNRERGIDESSPVNGRRMTNVGTFRAYVVAYLKEHPKIHDEMTFLVRQLAPTDKGLPLEVYVFSTDQRWAHYEAIQADIFDHLFATLREFDLRPFQAPTGHDIVQAVTRLDAGRESA